MLFTRSHCDTPWSTLREEPTQATLGYEKVGRFSPERGPKGGRRIREGVLLNCVTRADTVLRTLYTLYSLFLSKST